MPYTYNPFTGEFDRVLVSGSGAASIEFITGNNALPVGPDGAFNIDFVGAGKYTVTGNPGANSLTIDDDGTNADSFPTDGGTANPVAGVLNIVGNAIQGSTTSAAGNTVTITNTSASETQIGVSELATDAETIAGTDSIRVIVPTGLKAKLGVQTAESIPFGQGDSTALSWTAALTDGVVVIGSTAGSPAAANLTPGTGITIVNAANSITISADTSVLITQIDTQAGSATPVAGVIIINGGTGLSSAAAGNTITLNLNTPVVVADGGSGRTTATAFAVICGGTVATNPHQSVASVGTEAQVLTSNGPGALPTFQNSTGGAIQFDSDAGSANPAGGILEIVGVATQGSTTSAAGNTVTITNTNSSETQIGVIEIATDVETEGGADTTRAIVPTGLKAKLGVQTLRAIPFGQGDASAFGWTAALTDGQVVIGITGASPAAANITQGTGMFIANAANSITLSVGVTVPLSFPTGAGTAIPALNALTLAGGTGINTTGGAATATINLDTPVIVANGGSGRTTATAFAVICGGTTTTNPHQSVASVGTADQVLTSNGAGALPTFQDPAVVGPVTSTDNALARWDGTSGDTLQDSTVIVTDAGEMTNASQPAFLAILPSTQTLATGDGTIYTMGAGTVALSEIYDQGGDFVTSGTFTAPISGRYHFEIGFYVGNIQAGHILGFVSLITSNRNYFGNQLDPNVVKTAANEMTMQVSSYADMDASDTATATLRVSGSTLVVTARGTGTNADTRFSGKLVC